MAMLRKPDETKFAGTEKIDLPKKTGKTFWQIMGDLAAKDKALFSMIVGGIVTVLVLVFVYISNHKGLSKPIQQTSNIDAKAASGIASDVGMFSETTAGEHYVDKMERMINDLKDQIRDKEQKSRQLERKLQLLEDRAVKSEKDTEEIKNTINTVAEKIGYDVQTQLNQIMGDKQSAPIDDRTGRREPPRMAVRGLADSSAPITIFSAKDSSMAAGSDSIANIPAEVRKWAYLPAGSYVKCTLLTPVDAPLNREDPMPVAIRADSVFYGANNSTVPLKNCIMIGAAWGDLATTKANVEIVKIIQVLDDGMVWEEEGGKSGNRLGWVVNGLEGKVVYKANAIMAKGAIASFVSAAADALGDNETTSTVSSDGTAQTTVTGKTTKYAAYKGASGFASALAKPYVNLLEQISPVVHVDAGREIYIFTLKGMEVKGLKAQAESDIGALY